MEIAMPKSRRGLPRFDLSIATNMRDSREFRECREQR
jgi:hypothetical protein